MADTSELDFRSLQLGKAPQDYVDIFLNTFFSQAYSIVEFEREFFKKHNLETTKIEYIKLRRFMTTAIRHFQELDDKFLTGLLLKVHKDTYSLFDFIIDLASKTKLPDLIFGSEFLHSIPEYVELQRLAEDSAAQKSRLEQDANVLQEQIKKLEPKIANQDIKLEHRKLKLSLGDKVHNFALARDAHSEYLTKLNIMRKSMAPIFNERFKVARTKAIEELSLYANSKAYYLDKLMWLRAQRMPAIASFMQVSGIEGDYDLKTFLKYYLKNINAASASDQEWHNYLVKAMEML